MIFKESIPVLQTIFSIDSETQTTSCLKCLHQKIKGEYKYFHNYGTGVIIDDIADNFIKNMVVFIMQSNKMWLSSPCDN